MDITKALSENVRLKRIKRKTKSDRRTKRTASKKILIRKEKQQAERKESENVEKTQQEQQYTENLEVLDIRVWITPTQKYFFINFSKITILHLEG